MTKKTYLVTGGTGFIGSALVRRLLQTGQRVRILDDNSRGSARRLQGIEGDIELVSADIRDSQAVINAARGVDSILHLAYVNGTAFFYTKPALVLDVGVRGMINVLDACRQHGIRELVLASSSEVYQTPPSIPTPENAPLSVPDPLNPRYSYGGGKIISELMAINYGREGFDRVLIFRPHNVYGPDMGWEHVLPQFALRLKRLCAEVPNGLIPFPIQGTGGETRSFIHIDDFAAAIMLILEKGRHLNIYHVGTDEERSIADAALCVAEYFGRSIQIEPGAITAGSTLRRCPSIEKLRSLGFVPQQTFHDGVFDLVRWYDANASLAPAAREGFAV